MRTVTIKMPYVGACLSVNHYLGRRKNSYGFYVKSETRAWMDEFGWKLKSSHIEDWKLPLTVLCSGSFKDKRSIPDLSNLSKVVLDEIEEITGINDQHYRWRDGSISISDEPTLTITITEGK